MDAIVVAVAVVAGLFWPVAITGVVLDAALWRGRRWTRLRRPWWRSAFALALLNVALTAGLFADQLLDGFYMALTWTPIAAIVLAWMVLGSWRRAERGPTDPDAAPSTRASR